MSVIKVCTTTDPPSTSSRSSWFLGCFGGSGEKMQPTDEVNSGSRRRWISKWKFSFKKSAVKTVPFDHTIVSRKSKSFQPSKKHAPATSNTTWEIQVVEEDATLTKKPVIMDDNRYLVEDAGEQSTRWRKWTDSVKSQNGSYRSRRKERKAAAATATGASALTRLGSPGKKSVTIFHPVVSSSPSKHLTRSTSPPPPKEKKLPHTPPVDGGVDEGTLEKTTLVGGGFDPIIGMSIILVTLVIMMLWGKLCAILCTSAWFFIMPRLGAAVEHSAVPMVGKRPPESHNNLDLESVEYKKKVVLDGLLQRNHRNVVGRL